MHGIVLANDQHGFLCFPGKTMPFASARCKNPVLAFRCRKSANFAVGFSSFAANNVKRVPRLSLDRIVSGKVNALANGGSDDGVGSLSLTRIHAPGLLFLTSGELPRKGALRKVKFERKETRRGYEKVKVASRDGTGGEKKQNFRRSLNGQIRAQQCLEEKDKPDSKENRVDREAKRVSKDESVRKERRVLVKDFNGRDAVVDHRRTSAAKYDSFSKERRAVDKDFKGSGSVVDRQHASATKDRSFGKERQASDKDFYGCGAVVDRQRTSAPKDKSFQEERRLLVRDFSGRGPIVDRQRTSAAKDESFREERQVLVKDFNSRGAIVDRRRTSAAKDESFREERQVLVKDFNGYSALVDCQRTSAANDLGREDRYAEGRKPCTGRRSSGLDRHVDSQGAETATYGNTKNNVKLLGNGFREEKLIVHGYSNEQRFRNKKKAWHNEDDDIGFEIDRAAFRTSRVPDEIVDKRKPSRMEMEERIQKLANGLNGADIEIPEWMFSQMMRSAKIKFCDHSMMRIIQILGKFGNWRRVLQVIEWLQVRERYKSHKLRYVYTAALDAMGKARRPVEALILFHTMQNHMSSYPDLVAYHSIAVTLGQAGHMKELFDVIDVMKSPPKKIKASKLLGWDPRLEPDLVVYNAVLNACVKRKQWEGAFWVLQQLEQSGQKPSSTTYGLVMEVMFACEKYNLVHELFRKVKRSGIPSALIYKVLVNTLWREGKTDEAVSAVREMEQRGIVGPAALYYDLARCLCSAGRCQEALLLIDKICKVASKPLVVTYTGLIQTCLDTGEFKMLFSSSRR
ncbi:hypothetical protein MLD38_027653 [Melastoma candidum]|uniref:Uncharacterized protein n=1 Tax=Melastoma candidum TaxID=119954 RepID=A0ACB9P871_9MYRT|nr:hypothetical protein MLD38_027653 [Melastoma candidum]